MKMVLLETAVGLMSVDVDQIQVVSEPRWRSYGWRKKERVRVLYLPNLIVPILNTSDNLRRLERAVGQEVALWDRTAL